MGRKGQGGLLGFTEEGSPPSAISAHLSKVTATLTFPLVGSWAAFVLISFCCVTNDSETQWLTQWLFVQLVQLVCRLVAPLFGLMLVGL